jgi:hypothetical protein
MKQTTVLFAVAVAACAEIAPWACSYQQWGAYDRDGVTFAQGDSECDAEAKTATANIGQLPDRVLNFNAFKSACLRQRGY